MGTEMDGRKKQLMLETMETEKTKLKGANGKPKNPKMKLFYIKLYCDCGHNHFTLLDFSF